MAISADRRVFEFIGVDFTIQRSLIGIDDKSAVDG